MYFYMYRYVNGREYTASGEYNKTPPVIKLHVSTYMCHLITLGKRPPYLCVTLRMSIFPVCTWGRSGNAGQI